LYPVQGKTPLTLKSSSMSLIAIVFRAILPRVVDRTLICWTKYTLQLQYWTMDSWASIMCACTAQKGNHKLE